MIAIFSDTHSARGHELEGEALVAAREADAVIHAGDFTTLAALEAFRRECSTFYAVHGNADGLAVRDGLPAERVVDTEDIRFAVTHHREGGETGLAMFGRARDAHVVVSGHTHRPGVVETNDIVLLNPGSHAQPRGNRPGFALLEREDDGVRGRILEPTGALLESFTLER